ncbi:hypothetical protein E3N88_09169 [Mikania micrantha]|uniref:Uncharacterized protein n=1 Tax=Mikania micrantha TaxID=192012 RepID=A0A5N6PKK1_9ASTR|nr:hypothetical protein E3N88_09169 [Mikania micrantha]
MIVRKRKLPSCCVARRSPATYIVDRTWNKKMVVVDNDLEAFLQGYQASILKCRASRSPSMASLMSNLVITADNGRDMACSVEYYD